MITESVHIFRRSNKNLSKDTLLRPKTTKSRRQPSVFNAHICNAFNDLNSFKHDDVEYQWKPSSIESFPDLFYGIAIYSDEKDDIQRIFHRQQNGQTVMKCNTDGLLQFGTKEANEHMKRLIDSNGEQIFIDKDFFHFSPQGRDLYFGI